MDPKISSNNGKNFDSFYSSQDLSTNGHNSSRYLPFVTKTLPTRQSLSTPLVVPIECGSVSPIGPSIAVRNNTIFSPFDSHPLSTSGNIFGQ